MTERQLEKERARYVSLCLACREHGGQVLETELGNIIARLDRLGGELSQVISALQNRSGNWLQRRLRTKDLQDLAAAEFDTLAGYPYVSEVDFDPAEQYLEVTTVPVVWDGRTHATPAAPLRLRIHVTDGDLDLDPSYFARGRLGVSSVAPALIAAGELAGLVALMLGPLTPEPANVSASVTPDARKVYIRWRTRLLLESQGEDKLQKKAETRLATITREMAALVRRAGLIEHALTDLQAVEERVAEDYGLEFDLLCQLPGVSTISVDKAAIHVQTEPIILQADGVLRRIGRFRIDIHPGKQVEMHNLGERMSSSKGCYDHPHVRRGQPCWGNSQSFFATQLAQHNFPAIIQQAIEFLHSYNSSNPFINADRWPSTSMRPLSSSDGRS